MELVIFVILTSFTYLLIGAVLAGIARRFGVIAYYEVEMVLLFWPMLIVMGVFNFIATLIAGD